MIPKRGFQNLFLADDRPELPLLGHVLDGRVGHGGHDGGHRRDRRGHRGRTFGLRHRVRHRLQWTGTTSNWHLDGRFFQLSWKFFMIPSFAEFLTGGPGFGGVVIWKPPGSRSPRSRPSRSPPPVSNSVPTSPSVPRITRRSSFASRQQWSSPAVSNQPSISTFYSALSSR